MPIDYKKYPPNWKETRERILNRAENKCECCGIENKSVVHSFFENSQKVWRFLELSEWYAKECPKSVTVVLTIAHLDHDESNHDVTDDRLKAMCQLCHLRYDAPEKSRRRKIKNSI